MPYIKPELRISLEDALHATEIEDVGQLNFAITTLCDNYISNHGKNYTNLNEVIGVLECAKLEMYRRVVAPYEDTKIIVNGDVYFNA